MSDVHDLSYYGKCMIGGIFACGLTHAAICPLDIVKCRKQVSFKIVVFQFELESDILDCFRPTLLFTRAFLMVSELSAPLRASRVSLS